MPWPLSTPDSQLKLEGRAVLTQQCIGATKRSLSRRALAQHHFQNFDRAFEIVSVSSPSGFLRVFRPANPWQSKLLRWPYLRRQELWTCTLVVPAALYSNWVMQAAIRGRSIKSQPIQAIQVRGMTDDRWRPHAIDVAFFQVFDIRFLALLSVIDLIPAWRSYFHHS